MLGFAFALITARWFTVRATVSMNASNSDQVLKAPVPLRRPMIGVFALVLTTTGYVGLGSILAGLTMLPAMLVLGGGQASLEWWVAGVVVALFLLFTHRVNLQRLRAGNEHRFEKARVLARLFAR